MPWRGGVAPRPVGSLKRLLGDTGAQSQTQHSAGITGFTYTFQTGTSGLEGGKVATSIRTAETYCWEGRRWEASRDTAASQDEELGGIKHVPERLQMALANNSRICSSHRDHYQDRIHSQP